jgi:hypothetical protein
MQRPIAVGADLHAGPDLLEFRRLLVNVDIVPALEKRQRRREAADPAAGDEDMVFHASVLSPMLACFAVIARLDRAIQ